VPIMKTVYDVEAGEQAIVAMTPEEEAVHLAQQALAALPPPPNPFAILRSLLEFTEGPEDLKLILDAQFELLGG
jgi:hypothetical protein